MKTPPASKAKEADQVWLMLVPLVFENRDDWRRRVAEVTGLAFQPDPGLAQAAR